MAKIVIVAPAGAEDVDDAVKLLKAAGHDVETEEPTPKALLHIVLGLMGPNAYGFGAGYAYAPGPQADDALEEPVEDDIAADETALEDPEEGEVALDDMSADDDFNFEGASVDGEPILAVQVEDETSVLIVEKLVVGPKTTYVLNESAFSFWPADQEKPMQRVDVGTEKWRTSMEIEVQLGEKQELRVGKDLIKLFEADAKKEWAVWKEDDNQSAVYFGDDEEKAKADHKKKRLGAQERGSDPTLYKVGLRTRTKAPAPR